MGSIFYLSETAIDIFLFHKGLDVLSYQLNSEIEDAHKGEILYCISNIAAGND